MTTQESLREEFHKAFPNADISIEMGISVRWWLSHINTLLTELEKEVKEMKVGYDSLKEYLKKHPDDDQLLWVENTESKRSYNQAIGHVLTLISNLKQR